MIEISRKLEDTLFKELNHNQIGIDTPWGAIIGEAEFILYYPDKTDKVFLAHKSEFEFKGVCVRLKKEKNNNE